MREHGDRERSIVAWAELALEGNPVERPADRGLEIGERPWDERDPGRVRADARERIGIVAADAHVPTGDACRLGREAPLRLSPGRQPPTEDQPALRSTR